MKVSNCLLAICAAMAAIVVPSAAQAARTAINQNPDGSPISYYLSGYCDLNGDDCDPDFSGGRLGYEVSFNGSDFSNKVFVVGNGLVTFGAPVDFFYATQDDGSDSLSNRIGAGDQPSLTDYNVNLVSAGQSNDIDFSSGNVFMQSATLSLRSDGSILANFFTCWSPTQHGCPKSNSYSLLLRPGKLDGETGFLAYLFGSGSGYDGGAGYATDGTEVLADGNSFFIPAQFRGDVTFSAAPEPATWGLMILGFGAIGTSLRRRRPAAMAA
jgi:hypothetical protein